MSSAISKGNHSASLSVVPAKAGTHPVRRSRAGGNPSCPSFPRRREPIPLLAAPETVPYALTLCALLRYTALD